MDYRPPNSKWFEDHNLDPPETIQHGLDVDIRQELKTLKVSNWRMEGPGNLIGDTEHGRLVQQIDPSYICKGTDDQGLPILEKIGK